jgi:hypothetical protein
MNKKNKSQESQKSLGEIRRNQPRVTYAEAMSQHQRMMKATLKGGGETRSKKAA